MKILGIEGLTLQELEKELDQGAQFITYQYCISVIVLSFKRSSNIYFIRVGDSKITNGLLYSFISILLGWWGVPWGPIYTVGSLVTNFKGGKDVTQEVHANIKRLGLGLKSM